MDVRKTPLVWVLLGSQRGDNNQLRALAEALGLPYETKQITYNPLGKLAFLRGQRLLYLTQQARQILAPPWPDLVLGLGYASMPVARSIRRRSGGRARLVHIGNPRTRLADIDLVLTTPQYPLTEAANIVILPFPIGNPARAVTLESDEARWLRRFPRPRRLVAVGGSTRQWRIEASNLDWVIQHLQTERARHGGSVIAVTSPRTGLAITHLLRSRLTGKTDACVEDFPR